MKFTSAGMVLAPGIVALSVLAGAAPEVERRLHENSDTFKAVAGESQVYRRNRTYKRAPTVAREFGVRVGCEESRHSALSGSWSKITTSDGDGYHIITFDGMFASSATFGAHSGFATFQTTNVTVASTGSSGNGAEGDTQSDQQQSPPEQPEIFPVVIPMVWPLFLYGDVSAGSDGTCFLLDVDGSAEASRTIRLMRVGPGVVYVNTDNAAGSPWFFTNPASLAVPQGPDQWLEIKVDKDGKYVEHSIRNEGDDEKFEDFATTELLGFCFESPGEIRRKSK